MVVRDGECSTAAREDRLKHVRRLNTGLIHTAVLQEHQLERTRRTIGDDHHEALRVAVEEFGADDVGDRFVVSEPGPRR